jgi:hypothetical protein
MPKRMVRSAKQIAAQRKAAKAAADKRRALASYTHPLNKRARLHKAYYAGKLTYTPPGVGGRRSKLGGKAYTKKTATNFKMADEAKAILAGKQGFRDQRVEAMKARAALGIGPKVPSASWYGKGEITPSKAHGSGTGLTSAYRYGPDNPATRSKKKGK